MSEFSLDVINKNRGDKEVYFEGLKEHYTSIKEIEEDFKSFIDRLKEKHPVFKEVYRNYDDLFYVVEPETNVEVCVKLAKMKKELEECQEKQRKLQLRLAP